MNHLLPLEKLKNRYFVQRHGESQANKQGLILSHPLHGQSLEFGLTKKGKLQAGESARKAKGLLTNSIIYCSNFSRARQTARITSKTLGTDKVHLTNKLRERYFGNWERTGNENYGKVWLHDKNSTNHKNEGVESINEVLDRVTSFILSLEKKYSGEKILLVSHGDTLQILQTAFEKINGTKHRNLPHLEVAEIRELKLKS